VVSKPEVVVPVDINITVVKEFKKKHVSKYYLILRGFCGTMQLFTHDSFPENLGSL
jgi:hypothetical protein